MSIPFAHKFQKRFKKISFLWIFCITFLQSCQSIYKNITYFRPFFGKTLQHFTAFPVFRQVAAPFARKRTVLDAEIMAIHERPSHTEKRTGTASFRQITDSFDHIMIINSDSQKMKMHSIGAKRPFSGGSLHLPALRPPSFRLRPPPPYRPHARCLGSQAPSEALHPTP